MNLSESDYRVIGAADEAEFIFHRQLDGSLKPSNAHRYRKQQFCSTHAEYDAGLDGRCVRCGLKIAPRTVIIIEDSAPPAGS